MEIIIENLTLAIGEKNILTNVSFTFKPGLINRIYGKNGSGKTSLIKCILGIYNDYSGNIYVDGVNLTNINQDSFNKQISYLIDQKMFYKDLSIKENLEIFKYYYQVKEFNVELNLLLKRFELDLNLNEKAKNLSEGFKKKLTIVLNLINNGDCILLDEPYNFLDQAAEDALTVYLKNSIKQNKNVILSAHQKHIFNDLSHSSLSL